MCDYQIPRGRDIEWLESIHPVLGLLKPLMDITKQNPFIIYSILQNFIFPSADILKP
jgi:hypothetical protein